MAKDLFFMQIFPEIPSYNCCDLFLDIFGCLNKNNYLGVFSFLLLIACLK